MNALSPDEVTEIRAVTEDMTPTNPPPDHRLIEGRDYVVCFFGTSTLEERYAVEPQTAEMMPAGTSWVIQRVQGEPWSLRAR